MPQPVRIAHSINFELLDVFVAIADSPSLAAAARHLGISSSQATRKLAQLEESLGGRLFNRTTRALKLTEVGIAVLDWARETLASRAGMLDDIASLSDRPSGTIRLAANHFVAAKLMPAFIAGFSKDYPDIRFSITATDSVVRMVDEGYDVAVHAGRFPDSGVVGVRVHEFRRIVCAAPSYLARFGVPRHPADLARHQCLSHSATESPAWFFLRGDKLMSQAVVPHVRVDNHTVLHELARAGAGLVRLSEMSMREDLERGRLVQVLRDFQCVSSNGKLPDLRVLYPSRRLVKRTRLFVDALILHLQTAQPAS